MPIGVIITDDDTDTVSGGTTVQVTNLDPEMTGLISSNEIPEEKSDDGIVTIEGTFTDIGVLDTHTVVVDWGDTSGDETLTSVDQVNDTFDATHKLDGQKSLDWYFADSDGNDKDDDKIKIGVGEEFDQIPD